jgi:acylglycerol lipase
MKHTESGWTTTDGLRLYAQCWQPDTAPTAVVCLVHGLGEHGGRYAHVAAFLTAHGYALYSFDLRGHGKSEGARGHSPAYSALMDDVTSFLAEAGKMFPGTPRVLYGHSLGGGIVLNYGLRRNTAELRGIIASAPALALAFAPSPLTMTLGKVLHGVAPALLMANGLDRNGLSHDTAVVEAYGADPLVHDRVSARLGMDFLDAGAWALAHAGDWSLPLLLMHGSADPICSAAASRTFAAKAGAQCTLRIFDDCYHEIHNELCNQQVFDVVLAWLNTELGAA